MTCIVGLKDKDITYMGADSLSSNGFSQTVRKDKKIFKLKDVSSAIIGYTGSFRMGQLLMYTNNLIDKREKTNINHEYLVKYFAPNIIKLFKDGGYSTNCGGEEKGGTFLFAYKDKLYKVEEDYQIGESYYNYNACGCGEPYALGSLYTTENMNLNPVERIYKALQAATKFAMGVAPPYYIMNTRNDEVIEFKE